MSFMSFEIPLALLALVVWIVVTFITPLGPHGAVLHLLLGVAAALFVHWWAVRKPAPPA